MNKTVIAVLACILTLPNVGRAESKSIAVVFKLANASFVDNAGSSTLTRGEVVQILKHSGDYVVVKRLEAPPDWEILQPESIEKAKRPLTLRADNLVSVLDFKPLRSWDSRRWPKYISCSGSCDSGTTFYFKPDGTFTASIGGGNSLDDPPAKSARGQIFSYRDLYWARINGMRSNDVVFYIKDDQFCDYVACGSP